MSPTVDNLRVLEIQSGAPIPPTIYQPNQSDVKVFSENLNYVH